MYTPRAWAFHFKLKSIQFLRKHRNMHACADVFSLVSSAVLTLWPNPFEPSCSKSWTVPKWIKYSWPTTHKKLVQNHVTEENKINSALYEVYVYANCVKWYFLQQLLLDESECHITPQLRAWSNADSSLLLTVLTIWPMRNPRRWVGSSAGETK